MLESTVAFYLNKYLGRFVDGIDEKSLRCAAAGDPRQAG